MPAFAQWWGEYAVRALVEGTFVFALVLAVWWPLRRFAPPQLGYGLFLLVPLKLIVPFEIAVPASVADLFPAAWLGAVGSGAADPVPVLTTVAQPWVVTESLPAEAWSMTLAGAAPDPTLTPLQLLFAAYVAIVVFLVTRFLWVQWRTARLVQRARPLRDGELAVDPHALRVRAGVRAEVRFLVTDEIETPAAGGLRRPYVLLPAGLLPRLAPRPLQWILLHELAHIRRGDIPVTLVQRFVQILFFFHPALWVANRIVDEQREFVCDHDALAVSGAGRSECGEGFLSVVEWASARATSSAATLAMFDSKSAIRRRLMRILQHPDQSRFSKLLSGAVVAAAACVLLPSVKAADTAVETATLRPQDPEKLNKLKREIDRLERAQRELRRELEAMNRKKGVRVRDVDDRDDDHDDDDESEDFVFEVDGKTKPGVYWLERSDGTTKLRRGKGPEGARVLITPGGEPIRVENLPKALESAGGRFEVKGGKVSVRPGGARVLTLPPGHRVEAMVEVDPDDDQFHRGKHVIELKTEDGQRTHMIELDAGDGTQVMKIEGLPGKKGTGVFTLKGGAKGDLLGTDGGDVEVLEVESDGGNVFWVSPRIKDGEWVFETKVDRDDAGAKDKKNNTFFLRKSKPKASKKKKSRKLM